MMSPETLAGMLDFELDRALDRLRRAKAEIEKDIAELEVEQRKRAERRRERRR
jgi:hypothetical protein